VSVVWHLTSAAVWANPVVKAGTLVPKYAKVDAETAIDTWRVTDGLCAPRPTPARGAGTLVYCNASASVLTRWAAGCCMGSWRGSPRSAHPSCTLHSPLLPPPYGLHSVPLPRPQSRHTFPLPHRCLRSNSNLHSFHDLRTHIKCYVMLITCAHHTQQT